MDQAGNESEATDVSSGMPMAPGPTPVAGLIDSDTTWFSGAGPYIIENTVTVKDGAFLKIEPGTEIRSKGAALIVEGKLDARGDGEHLITFDSVDSAKPWLGIVFVNLKDRDNVIRFVHIRNAAVGVDCLNSSPRIESSEFTENGTAIKVTGAFSKPSITANSIHKNSKAAVVIVEGSQPVLKENRVMDNAREGIFIEGATPSIAHNMIFRNRGAGVVSTRSRPFIAENNIADNDPFEMIGDAAGDAVQALNNWWGTAETLKILTKLKGRINIKSILDKPWPDGNALLLPILDSAVKGVLTSDIYLTLSNSPYRVKGDVRIDSGATLYIEPGVVILYDANTSILTADGGIMARGTKDRPITFTAAAASPAPGFFMSAVRMTQATKVNSAFVYCIVEYGTIAFDIFHGSPEITRCRIAHNSQSGIYCGNDSRPKVSYNTFWRNGGEGGIRCVGSSNPFIHRNNFIDNTVAVQTFSTIHIDARNNWWGHAPPDRNQLWGENINIDPWLIKPEKNAFREEEPAGER